jgi:hypothetical protein
MNPIRSLCTAVLLLGLIAVPHLLGGDYSVETDKEKIFSGTEVKLEDAASKSTAIFVGKVQSSVPGAATGPNSAYCKIKNMRVLTGSVDPAVLVSMLLLVVDGEGTPKYEEGPQIGYGYLFFMQDSDRAFKVLPATEKNINAVKRLLPSRGHKAQ